ncbi:hypothetical protein [Neglectibacter timonensis]|uniref:Uncharacterized protein n=2 Tax=Neglectibacter timonensis TaxID=1776382 RepID=A0ABT1RW47_9FIRM|nr:hypothetical protein [Neglectibacter timonensis]MCQ4838900.1 hypothetical protein [Neglectibacter timonensis]MCQ4842876.1 hypothetical protein [Neglectibacter timonensis]MEE0730346.1 hypothetical protein [Oscillospiraceae bacterium]
MPRKAGKNKRAGIFSVAFCTAETKKQKKHTKRPAAGKGCGPKPAEVFSPIGNSTQVYHRRKKKTIKIPKYLRKYGGRQCLSKFSGKKGEKLCVICGFAL